MTRTTKLASAMMDDASLVVRVIHPAEETERIERMMADADDRTREVLERYAVAFTRSPSDTAATQGYACEEPRGLSASAARSWCADPSTSTASTSCWRAYTTKE